MPVKKTKEVIIEILQEEGELGTSEIYDLTCTILYHGVTMNQLTNILTRTPEIQKGDFQSYTRNGFRVRERLWRLKE